MPNTATAEAVNGEIRAGMARRRLTQAQVGKALGVTQTQVSARLAGDIDWRLAELRVVAQLIGVPLQEILCESPRARA